MEETLKLIAERLTKDCYDYLAMFAPLFLSMVAILISLWNSFWSNNIKKIEANLIWDEALMKFFIVIRNTGKKTVVINSVCLDVKNSSNGVVYKLGERKNLWSCDDKGYIIPNQILKYSPCFGSNYDVFAYYGHGFTTSKETNELFPNDNLKVNLKIEDMDGQTWNFKTIFSIGDINEKLYIGS